MGFEGDPQMCFDKAGRDCRMLNCSIFYKRCQEVDTIAKQMLLGVPNSIDDKQIQRIMDRELIELEINEKRNPKSPVARYGNGSSTQSLGSIPQECHGKALNKKNKRWEQAEQGWYTCCMCINQTMIESKRYCRLQSRRSSGESSGRELHTQSSSCSPRVPRAKRPAIFRWYRHTDWSNSV